VIQEPPFPADGLEALRAPFRETGAIWVQPPVLQPLSLVLDLAGEALRSRLFVLQAAAGQEVCLRPDFTTPVARLHLASGATGGNYAYEGLVFRASEDEAEEVLQIGIERFAAASDRPADDAELVDLLWRAAKAGGRGDLSLRLGDAGLFGAFLDALGLHPAQASRLTRRVGRPSRLAAELERNGQAEDRSGAGEGVLSGRLAALPPGEASALLEEVWTLAGITPVGGRTATEIAARLVTRSDASRAPALSPGQVEAVRAYLSVSGPPRAALAQISGLASPAAALRAHLADWERRLDGIEAASAGAAPAVFDAAPPGDFAYYDGLVIEIVSEALGPARPVAVGGRYDSLPARLSGGSNGGGSALGGMIRPGRALVEVGQ
jgi:ATP phosphoribosyltransferase regulatory subunit